MNNKLKKKKTTKNFKIYPQKETLNSSILKKLFSLLKIKGNRKKIFKTKLSLELLQS